MCFFSVWFFRTREMSVYLHGKRIFSPAAGLEHIDLSAFINRVQLKQSKAEESADLKKPNA